MRHFQVIAFISVTMKGIIVLLSIIIAPALCGPLSLQDSLRLSRPVVGKVRTMSIWTLNKPKIVRFG